jgi:hypothetical protein
VLRRYVTVLRRRVRPNDDEFLETCESAIRESAELGLRLIPVVGGDLCYPVAAALLRGKIEEAAKLVPPMAWVPVAPMYG